MGATVIDGKALASATKAEAAEKVRELKSRGINPCLAVILVGENPASQVYVRGKINDCAQCGIESRSINLPADTTQDALLAEVKKLADDSAVHGILVQLPLPAQIDEKAVIDAIPPEKDVDGFSPVNVGRMQIGEPCYLPCTPAGCIRMIESTGTDIAGKNAVVIGRSNIVGKPAALLLLAKNATVTICHSRTKNLKEVCAAADILVAAVGREGFVTGDMVKPGAVVIDVGINRGADGKLHGDVNFAEAAEKAAYEAKAGHPVHDFYWFTDLYKQMPFGNPAYHELFRLLEEHRVPLLFHCTCGKDRTGIAAMLVLLALGVSREDAIADYMLTNVYRKAIIDKFMQDKPADQYDLLLPVEGVSESMGAGSIDVLLEKYPSYEAYFEAEYGLTTARLAALRDFYLE